MSTKRYATDEAKSKSREIVRTMIESTLLTYRKPSELKVICFPGIDCAEIFEVYDSLGILRGNITGVERDREVAAEIRSHNLGINLIENTLEDYIERRGRHDFDVISLDYIGPLGHSSLDVLKKFVAGQQRDHFVLHHANLLRRDHNAIDLYYYGNAVANRSRDQLGSMPSPHDFSSGIETGILEFLTKQKAKEKLTSEKQTGYSTILEAVYSASNVESVTRFLKYAGGRNYYAIIQKLKERNPLCRELDNDDPMGSSFKSPFFPVIQNVLERVGYESIMLNFSSLGLHDKTVQYLSWVMLFMASKPERFFISRRMEKYSYISQSGAPMIGDIAFLTHPRKAKKLSDELGQMMNFPREVSFRSHDLYRIHKLAGDYSKQMNELKPLEQHGEKFTAPRTFLGNSFRAKLSKEKAIDEFRNGVSAAELRCRYRGWEGMPLQQWKAHVTMGTYDPKEEKVAVGTEERETVPGDEGKVASGLETVLSKDEVLDLLSSGIPIKEVLEAFPESFTAGQLAAFKAHITMGTYGKEKKEVEGIVGGLEN